jgi:hypothetical protein
MVSMDWVVPLVALSIASKRVSLIGVTWPLANRYAKNRSRIVVRR